MVSRVSGLLDHMLPIVYLCCGTVRSGSNVTKKDLMRILFVATLVSKAADVMVV